MQTVVTNSLNNKTKIEGVSSSLEVLKTTVSKTLIEYFSGSLVVNNLGSSLVGKTTSIIVTSSNNTNIEVSNLQGKTSIGPVVNLTITGSSTVLELEASGPINSFKVIGVDNSGRATYASSDDLYFLNRIIGISISSALVLENVKVQEDMQIDNSGWNWPTNSILYLGTNGDILTYPSGIFCQPIGFSLSPTKIQVRIGRSIVLSN